MRAVLTMLVLGLGVLLVACGGEASSASSGDKDEVEGTVSALAESAPSQDPRLRPLGPTATAIPGRRNPPIRSAPSLMLETAGGTRITAGIGTRCWGGMCVDYVGPVTNASPVVLLAGAAFELTFEHGAPSETFEGWYKIPAGKQPEPTTGLEGAAWSIHPDDIEET